MSDFKEGCECCNWNYEIGFRDALYAVNRAVLMRWLGLHEEQHQDSGAITTAYNEALNELIEQQQRDVQKARNELGGLGYDV